MSRSTAAQSMTKYWLVEVSAGSREPADGGTARPSATDMSIAGVAFHRAGDAALGLSLGRRRRSVSGARGGTAARRTRS